MNRREEEGLDRRITGQATMESEGEPKTDDDLEDEDDEEFEDDDLDDEDTDYGSDDDEDDDEEDE